MKITILKLAILISLACITSLVHATIINKGSYLTDTKSSLDWINLNLTLGKSYSQIRNDPQFSDWRYATLSECYTLISDANNHPIVDCSITTAINIESGSQLDSLMSALGNTADEYAKKLLDPSLTSFLQYTIDFITLPLIHTT
jgi:hypothetical protein